MNWNGDTVTLRGIRTTLPKYTSMVHNVYEEATTLVRKLTLVLEQGSMLSILWDDIVENLSNRDTGFRLFNPKSPALALQSAFVYKRLLDSIRT